MGVLCGIFSLTILRDFVVFLNLIPGSMLMGRAYAKYDVVQSMQESSELAFPVVSLLSRAGARIVMIVSHCSVLVQSTTRRRCSSPIRPSVAPASGAFNTRVLLWLTLGLAVSAPLPVDESNTVVNVANEHSSDAQTPATRVVKMCKRQKSQVGNRLIVRGNRQTSKANENEQQIVERWPEVLVNLCFELFVLVDRSGRFNYEDIFRTALPAILPSTIF